MICCIVLNDVAAVEATIIYSYLPQSLHFCTFNISTAGIQYVIIVYS